MAEEVTKHDLAQQAPRLETSAKSVALTGVFDDTRQTTKGSRRPLMMRAIMKIGIFMMEMSWMSGWLDDSSYVGRLAQIVWILAWPTSKSKVHR